MRCGSRGGDEKICVTIEGGDWELAHELLMKVQVEAVLSCLLNL